MYWVFTPRSIPSRRILNPTSIRFSPYTFTPISSINKNSPGRTGCGGNHWRWDLVDRDVYAEEFKKSTIYLYAIYKSLYKYIQKRAYVLHVDSSHAPDFGYKRYCRRAALVLESWGESLQDQTRMDIGRYLYLSYSSLVSNQNASDQVTLSSNPKICS